jgi:CRISPR/Cas system-associated endonuclease Cas1
LKLVLDRPFDQGDFQFQADGSVRYCRIGNSLRKALIERLEAKLNSRLTHPVTGELGDFRRMIRIQIAHYIQVLEGVASEYRSFVLR